MDNFTKELNEMLYYNPEEFRKMYEYNQGKREGIEERNIEIVKIMMASGEDIEVSRINEGRNRKFKKIV